MYEIVKVLFPFADDSQKGKPRPALVVSPPFGPYQHTVLAYITTDVKDLFDTDIRLDASRKEFETTGLYATSVVKTHRLITVTPSQIGESIGVLPKELISTLKKKLKQVFLLP